MDAVVKFTVTFAATWIIVVLLLALYEGSTADGYRALDSKTGRIVVFAAVVAFWMAFIVVAVGLPFPTFKP